MFILDLNEKPTCIYNAVATTDLSLSHNVYRSAYNVVSSPIAVTVSFMA